MQARSITHSRPEAAASTGQIGSKLPRQLELRDQYRALPVTQLLEAINLTYN